MRDGHEDGRWLVGLVVVLVLGACQTAQSKSTTSGSASLSEVIGPAGGILSAPDGTSVEIPAGALASNLTVTITPAPEASPPAKSVWVGTPYVFGPEGTQFAKAATVTLAFSARLIPAGETASQVVVMTAPLDSTNYTPLGSTLSDATHVSALTTHFSTFGPAAGDDGGSTGGSLPDGGENTTGTTGGTGTGGTTTGIVPDAGEGTTGGTTGGGTTGGTTGGPSNCIGAGGCAVVSVTDAPPSGGGGACDFPFLAPQAIVASIANGDLSDPQAILFKFSAGAIWSVALTMTGCPGAAGGEIPVQASVELYPTEAGECSNAPYKGGGTIDFEPIDAGFAGTFQVALFGGMQGSFSFGQDPGLCDLPAALDAGTVPEDAGATSCDSSNACLPDAGTLTGTGAISVHAPGKYGTTWCTGPLVGLPSVATLEAATNGGPYIDVSYGAGLWEMWTTVSCCPASTGALSATVTVSSSVCGSDSNVGPVLQDVPGTVIFTATGADLTGWITVDGGGYVASFDIPGP